MSTRLYSRNAVILAKIETTEGTDSTPTGADNALLVSDLSVEPLAGGELDLAYIRPYFCISQSIRTENYLTASFTVDFAGTATAGTAPPWGPLARGCAFAQTLNGSAITGNAQAGGSSTTIVLAAGASATDNIYVGMTIDWDVSSVSSTGSRTIIAYNGTTKVATVNKAWDGDPPGATADYTIAKSAIYTPISTSFESLTIYYNINGVRHKMLGCKGTLSITQTARERPALRFQFTGIDGGVADASEATPVYTAWQTPQTINTANTRALIGGKQSDGSATGVQLMSFSLDMANTVAYRQLVGAENVILTDRQPRGTVSIEATTVTFKDWWTEIKASTKAALLIENGLVAGNITGVFLPNAQLAEPKYGDSDGIAMLECSVRALPLSGNDEVRLIVK